MTQYLKTVVTAVVAVSVITTLLPKDGFSKYVNLLTSILVMTIVISPVLKWTPEISNADIITMDIESQDDYVETEFKKNLAEKIKQELRDKTGKEFIVEVDATTEEIKTVKISPYNDVYVRVVTEFLSVGKDKVIEQ
jgi:stage III sporulation protein AF